MCAAAVKQPLRVIISGAPASGKGTQCALIVDEFDLVHLSTGDMLRAAVAAGTELGQSAKGFMDAGALVPDSLVIEMVIERVQREDCVVRGWLLDGFPRTENQARALDDAGVVPDAVVSLDVDDAMLVERVVGRRLDPKTGDIYHMTFNPPPAGEVAERCVQRSDDTEEKARTRLQAFHRNCAAIEYHYKSKLRHVDGVRSKESVFEDVKGILEEAKKQNDDDNAAGGVTASGGGAGGAKAKRNGSGMPVAEFVRRAEEAYERGYLSTEDVNWSGQARADAEDADGVSSISDVFRRLDVAAGDAAAILMFAFIGHAAHGSDSGSAVADVLRTAAPFLASWFLISPYLGAYKRAATRNVQAAVTSAVVPVLTSTSAGIAIRGESAGRGLALFGWCFCSARRVLTSCFSRLSMIRFCLSRSSCPASPSASFHRRIPCLDIGLVYRMAWALCRRSRSGDGGVSPRRLV
jgi:adenylate kinase